MSTIDTRERTAARSKSNTSRLSDINLYTLTELEGVLGLTHRTLQNYVKDGRLKAVKIGGKWRVTEDTLRKFVSGK